MYQFSVKPDNRYNTYNMASPVLRCINREEREKDGFNSFKEWVEKYDHEYIGPSIYKYIKNYSGKESMWRNPYQAHFPRDVANDLFEKFVRSNEEMMKRIPYLKNKVLGCWCESDCHGEVLIKLYNEVVHNKI